MIYNLLKGLSKVTASSQQVIADILLLQFTIVNACVAGNSNQWVLVDAGLENSYEYILKSVNEHLGKNSRP